MLGLGLMRVASVHYVDFNKRLDGMSLFRKTTLAWLLMFFL